jgi:hypothetical protein
MTTIQAIYQEIAGSPPDRDAVARIGRAGRLLNLTETDTGWLLLAVLAAHGALAQADLQSASTLAASLSIAANEAKVTTEAVGRAVATAATTITRVTDDAKPALISAVDTAAWHMAGKLESWQETLGQKIATLGTETGNLLVTRTNAACRGIETAIANAANEATGALWKKVDTAVGQAAQIIKDASNDLKNGAKTARDETIADWRSAVTTAVNAEISTRSIIDTQAAKRRTIRTSAVAGGLIAAIIAGVAYSAHRIGWQDGMQYGIGETLTRIHDQKARASWANTANGKLAYQLYQAGSIHKLAYCDQPGWTPAKKGMICYPHHFKGLLYGWQIRPKPEAGITRGSTEPF